MKKRIFSILLTLCMMICLVPTSVFAEGETNRKVETEQELVNALSDSSVDVITLKSDIEIGTTLIVDRNVTLDIYGYMLEISGKSREHLSTSLKKYYSVSPVEYISELRLNYAVNLMTSSNLNITDICYESGFSNLSWFYQVFENKYQKTPAAYKKSLNL